MGGKNSKNRPVHVEPPHKDHVTPQKDHVTFQNSGLPPSDSTRLDDVPDVPDVVETVQVTEKNNPSSNVDELHHEIDNEVSYEEDSKVDTTKIAPVSSENSFHTPDSPPVIFAKETFSNSPRSPLQFDMANTRPAGGPMTSSQFVTSSGLMTSSNRNQTSLDQSTRHFSANIASINGENGEKQFSKSQNFYNKSRDQSGWSLSYRILYFQPSFVLG